jgi:ferric-dicitrate binding protein FerR (iron transport regulator)
MSIQTPSDDLLAKCLCHEANALEQTLVQEWIAQNTENKQYFQDFESIWQNASSLKNPPTADTDAAWQRFRNRVEMGGKVMPLSPNIEQKQSQNTVKQPISVFNKTWFSIAAVLVAVLGLGILANYNTATPSSKIEMAYLETTDFQAEKILPDGTVVYLNANTKLSYPKIFDDSTRVVSLKGEAFFKVKHDPAHPFIIHAQGADVRVLGTSFNVKAYTTQVQVLVETGKVKFSKNDQKILLIKGEQAQLKQDTIVKATMADKNTMAYKTKILLFENSALNDVVKVLNEVYSSKITLKTKKLGNCKLNTSFENRTLDEILNIIAETFQLSINKKDDAVILDGQGCDNE